MTASHPGGNVLSAVRMWNSSFSFFSREPTHRRELHEWNTNLFSELLSVLPLITLRKREKCAPLTLLLKICYLPVISGQWLFCMYGLQNVYMLSLTAMKDCWNKLYSHGGTTWALLLIFFSSGYYPVCDGHIFSRPCVRDKQDIEESENLNRKRQGDKQKIPIRSATVWDPSRG